MRVDKLWIDFAVRKACEVLASALALVVIAFSIVYLIPGDPARAIAGVDAPLAEVEAVRTRLGLDQPFLTQLLSYIGGVLQGDFGRSFRNGLPVAEIIAARIPYTLALAGGAILVTLVVAIPLGMIVAAATRNGRRRWLDSGFSGVTAFLGTVPQFVTGALLVVIVAIGLGLLPAAGAAGPESYVLPIAALALGPTCAVARVVRREAQDVYQQEYMRTARATRVRSSRLAVKFALPNLMASTLTLSGLILAALLGGAIVIENVFAWPGLGRAAVQAILDRDYPLIQGILIVLGVTAIVLHTFVDIVLAVIDPRVLSAGKGNR